VIFVTGRHILRPAGSLSADTASRASPSPFALTCCAGRCGLARDHAARRVRVSELVFDLSRYPSVPLETAVYSRFGWEGLLSPDGVGTAQKNWFMYSLSVRLRSCWHGGLHGGCAVGFPVHPG